MAAKTVYGMCVNNIYDADDKDDKKHKVTLWPSSTTWTIPRDMTVLSTLETT